MGFALLLYLPPRWHKEPPSVLSEIQQNFLGSVLGLHGCAECSGALLGGMGVLEDCGEGGDLFLPAALTKRLGGTPQSGGMQRG